MYLLQMKYFLKYDQFSKTQLNNLRFNFELDLWIYYTLPKSIVLIVLFYNKPSTILLVYKATPFKIKVVNILVSTIPSEIWEAEFFVSFYPEISTDF